MEDEFTYNEVTYLDEVKTKILDPRREKLIEVLVNFIDTYSKNLIKEPVRSLYELKVVKFEFDQPFSFSYVAYSGCGLIPSECTNRLTENLKIEDAEYGELEEIFEGLGFESSDDVEWFNEKTAEYFNQHELCKKMECLWFHECWQIAKEKTLAAVNFRCFLIGHDDFGGIDADNGMFMTEKEIKKSLALDGLYSAPVYESKYIVHKNDSVQGWGTMIETFTDLELAFEYLKSIVHKSNEENAGKLFLIRKWLKMPIVEQGQNPWVTDTGFGKKFINEN